MSSDEPLDAHGGVHAIDVARSHGADTLFTLSGAHVFPIYDGAVKADPAVPIIDVRHEQTAVFAAEAIGKLTRTPGLAVLTAGPGVTNGVSAMAQAQFSGAPLVVVGGRAPAGRWGTGSLQELDHPPIVESITKSAVTAHTVEDIIPTLNGAFDAARSPHRGPAFVDIPMDQFFSHTTRVDSLPGPTTEPVAPDTDAIDAIAGLIAGASRPVLVFGGDIWADGAEVAALEFVERTRLPVIANGMGRGVVPAGHPCLVTKARSTAFGQSDLAVVIGTPLDFRLGYGAFGGKDGQDSAKVVHIADSPDQIAAHVDLAASVSGDLTQVFTGLAEAVDARGGSDVTSWRTALQDSAAAAHERDTALLSATADPIHPARIYGELMPRLADDAVVIGDGGDFVSFAGKFVEPRNPGCWLDPGPYGCLGAGLGAAMAARIARPESQVVVLFGDGAAGMSLIDVDTLVRHNLPVVMVVGNNGAWGLEKGPMQFLYGYDVAADLSEQTRYDEVVKALGGAGEMVTDPTEIGPALDRAFASGVPYLVNIITDVTAMYPRNTTGV